MPNTLYFTPLTEDDLITVKGIYDWYIFNSTATFHTDPIKISELKEFIYLNHPRYKSYLIKEKEVTIGFCYLTRYKNRQAYDRTAEVTLYLNASNHHKGVGTQALDFLEKKAKENGIKNLMGIITGTNTSSLKLFDKCGYHKCGHFKNVGEKFGQILDVLAYQKEI